MVTGRYNINDNSKRVTATVTVKSNGYGNYKILIEMVILKMITAKVMAEGKVMTFVTVK